MQTLYNRVKGNDARYMKIGKNFIIIPLRVNENLLMKKIDPISFFSGTPYRVRFRKLSYRGFLYLFWYSVCSFINVMLYFPFLSCPINYSI